MNNIDNSLLSLLQGGSAKSNSSIGNMGPSGSPPSADLGLFQSLLAKSQSHFDDLKSTLLDSLDGGLNSNQEVSNGLLKVLQAAGFDLESPDAMKDVASLLDSLKSEGIDLESLGPKEIKLVLAELKNIENDDIKVAAKTTAAPASVAANSQNLSYSQDYIENVNRFKNAKSQPQAQQQSQLQQAENISQKNKSVHGAQQYSRNYQQASNNLFESRPLFSNSNDVNNELAVQSQNTEFAISSPEGKGGFQMEANVSRQLAPQALVQQGQNSQTIDLSHIDANNRTELINKLMGEIEKVHFEKRDSLDLLVKHNDLGNFRVSVNKAGLGEQIDLMIQAQTREAHKFFADHEVELLKSLDRNGIKLAEFKLLFGAGKEFSQVFVESKNLSSELDHKDSDANDRENAEQNQRGESQRDQDSDRRKALWEQYQNSLAEVA